MNEMMMNLTESEMKALWKQVMNLDVPRRDCEIEREDGVDLDALIVTHMKQWYAHLLTTAQVEWLPVEEVKAEVKVTETDGVVTMTMPDRCVRPVEVKLGGWRRSVSEFLSPTSLGAQMQSSKYLRGGNENPVAVAYDNRLELYSVTTGNGATVLRARAVVMPADGTYTFHRDAISTIPHYAEGL